MSRMLIDELVKTLPVDIREAIEMTRRRINRVIMQEDVKAPDPLTEGEVKGVRLGMLAIELRKMMLRGEIALPTGDTPHHAIGLLDAALGEVGLLAIVKRASETSDTATTDVETTTRGLIATIRGLR